MEVKISLKQHTLLKKIGNPDSIVKELIDNFLEEYKVEEVTEEEKEEIETEEFSEQCNDFGEQEDIAFCNECKSDSPALYQACKKESEDNE